MSKKKTNEPDGDMHEMICYVVGEVYFFVTYPDTAMHFPLIESYLFLGLNFSEEDISDTWYFQSISDFSQFGSALKGHERPVFCANEEQLIEFQDELQLVDILKQAKIRRLNKREIKGAK